MTHPVALFAALAIAHLVADFPLQGEFLSRAKNVSAPLPGVPWRTALWSHAAIQGGGVWLVLALLAPAHRLDAPFLGLAEMVIHATLDHLKCKGLLGEGEDAFNRDQFFHLACKGVWVLATLV